MSASLVPACLAFAAFIAKAATGQIKWMLAIPILVAVIPSAFFGGYISPKVSFLWLRRILAFFIAAASVGMWLVLLF